ncbi:MAG: fatty acid desaturase family protein [bacterium]|nr:fatty acid desaturase family protein [bacterium]
MSTAVLEDPNAQASPEKPVRITDYVTPSELSRFTTRSNLRAFARVTFNWLAIAAIFAAVALFTNPVSILIALALLGGRQLAFAALMHDCGHHVLFENKFANHLAGQWLCAYPILSDVDRYAAGHRRHHTNAGTREDPDLPNYMNYPIHRESFRRKIWRDLTGRTGWKALAATWRRGKTQLRKAPWNGNALLGHVIVNASMFAALYAVGEGWLYLMWPASFLTTYMLFARLRQVAEHGAVADLYDLDPRKNTRTLLVRWWERPFVGPFNLNYHLEHHLHAGVPCYRLKDFHDFLLARGFYDDTHFPRGYGELLATAVRR